MPSLLLSQREYFSGGSWGTFQRRGRGGSGALLELWRPCHPAHPLVLPSRRGRVPGRSSLPGDSLSIGLGGIALFQH